MHKKLFLSLLLLAVLIVPLIPERASALSCLPVDMYLKDVVSDENIVIFTATATKQLPEKAYTAEFVTVDTVLQGYVEATTFVYHQKDETWGYLCNNGPHEQSSEPGLYVATRDAYGKYQVYQRLPLSSEYVTTLKADLKAAEVTGEKVTLSSTDRMNQIMTTISDMLSEIVILLKEYAFWKAA